MRDRAIAGPGPYPCIETEGRAWKRTDRAPPLLLCSIYLTGNKPHKLRETRNPIAHQVKEAMKVHQAISWSQPLGDSGRSFLVSSIPTQAGKESISFDASLFKKISPTSSYWGLDFQSRLVPAQYKQTAGGWDKTNKIDGISRFYPAFRLLNLCNKSSRRDFDSCFNVYNNEWSVLRKSEKKEYESFHLAFPGRNKSEDASVVCLLP